MPTVACEGRSVPVREGETVLDALLQAGLEVSSSCRAGACQACLVRATRGVPPTEAQRGIKESLRLQGYFLACQARPDADLEVSLDATRALEVEARVDSVRSLAADVLLVRLCLEGQLEARPGQFLTLVRGDGLARSYSIANTPSTPEGHIDLHVRVYAGGRMSGWLNEPGALAERVRLRGPFGDCFYVRGRPQERLLMIGTGTGLAPLWGVLHDALAQGHEGPLDLWHGALDSRGLYLAHELRELERRNSNVRFHGCVLGGEADEGVTVGNIDEVALTNVASLAEGRVYLCGDPGLVQRLKRQAFLKGASLQKIHSDSFVPSA